MWESWSERLLCSSCHFSLAWHSLILSGSEALGPLLWLLLPCRHQAKSFMGEVAYHFRSLSSFPSPAYSVSAGLRLFYCNISILPPLLPVSYPIPNRSHRIGSIISCHYLLVLSPVQYSNLPVLICSLLAISVVLQVGVQSISNHFTHKDPARHFKLRVWQCIIFSWVVHGWMCLSEITLCANENKTKSNTSPPIFSTCHLSGGHKLIRKYNLSTLQKHMSSLYELIYQKLLVKVY